MDVVILLLRTLFFYGLIRLITKTFTKNRKLTLVDLLVAIMISVLAVLSIERPGQPLVFTFLPMLFLLALHLILTFALKGNRKKSTEKKKAPIIPRLADVEMGLLEHTVVNPPVKNLPLPLILDGKVLDYNLDKLGKTRFWLKNQVQNFGVKRFQEVAYCSIDENGGIFLDKK